MSTCQAILLPQCVNYSYCYIKLLLINCHYLGDNFLSKSQQVGTIIGTKVMNYNDTKKSQTRNK